MGFLEMASRGPLPAHERSFRSSFICFLLYIISLKQLHSFFTVPKVAVYSQYAETGFPCNHTLGQLMVHVISDDEQATPPEHRHVRSDST